MAGVALGFDAVDVAQPLSRSWPGYRSRPVELRLDGADPHVRAPKLVFVPRMAAIVVLASPSFAYWATASLGEGPVRRPRDHNLGCRSRRPTRWMIAAALAATVLRPEGCLVAGIAFGFHLWRGRHRGWHVLGHPLVYVIGLVLLTAFRLWYYGSPVPNTFYAKVGPVPLPAGVQYLIRFLWARERSRCGARDPAVIVDPRTCWLRRSSSATAAVSVGVGGDVFALCRFPPPALPALTGLAVYGVSTLTIGGDRSASWEPGGVIASCSRPFGMARPSTESLWPPARLPRNVTLTQLWQINARMIRGARSGASHLAAITTAAAALPPRWCQA